MKKDLVMMNTDLEGEHSGHEIGSLDLRNVGGHHFVSIGSLSVQSITLPWTCSPCPP